MGNLVDRMDRTRWAIVGVVAVVLVATYLLAAGGQVSTILSTVGASIPAAPVGGPATGGDVEEPAGGGDPGRAAVVDASRPELLIIKTGTIELQVEAVDAAVEAAEARIAALGGYVSGSEQVGDGENVSATITYRLPADQWSAALRALRGLAIKVVSERTGTEDVTDQVVDLRARIANLQATERALQAIMGQATRIADILDVQAELTKVRGEIEEATSRTQHLEEQAAYSTLSVRFGLQPAPAVAVAQDRFDPGAEVDRATANLVEILQALATAGIWFGIVWLPILLALGIVTLIAWLVLRRLVPGRAVDGWSGLGGPPLPPADPAAPVAPAGGG
jgi:hypothetical protein